jgi:hypothetical protein
MKPHARVAQPLVSSKAAGKRKASVAEVEEDDESDASQDSNATGFSDLEDDELMGDEMDVDALEEGEKGGDEGQDDEEMDTEDEIDAAKDGKKKSKKNTSAFSLRTPAHVHRARAHNVSSILRETQASNISRHLWSNSNLPSSRSNRGRLATHEALSTCYHPTHPLPLQQTPPALICKARAGS